MAPVFAFQKIYKNENKEQAFVAGGNFFDVIPYEGRYDAQPMSLFSITRDNKIKHIPQQVLSNIKGQVRDLKWIRMNDQRNLLMIARNNDSMIFMQLN